jgi:translation elongation factor EF-G
MRKTLAMGLAIGMAHRQFYPVFCASGQQDMGSGRIMGFIHDICPSPKDRPAADARRRRNKALRPECAPLRVYFQNSQRAQGGQCFLF